MSTYILFVWTIVAGGAGYGTYWDWRPMGVFQNKAACEVAADALGYRRVMPLQKDVTARCLPTVNL